MSGGANIKRPRNPFGYLPTTHPIPPSRHSIPMPTPAGKKKYSTWICVFPPRFQEPRDVAEEKIQWPSQITTHERYIEDVNAARVGYEEVEKSLLPLVSHRKGMGRSGANMATKAAKCTPRLLPLKHDLGRISSPSHPIPAI